MTTTAEFEGAGAVVATDCIDAILHSTSQAEAYRAVLKMLDALSGSGRIAKDARKGASTILVAVLKRGLDGVRVDALSDSEVA